MRNTPCSGVVAAIIALLVLPGGVVSAEDSVAPYVVTTPEDVQRMLDLAAVCFCGWFPTGLAGARVDGDSLAGVLWREAPGSGTLERRPFLASRSGSLAPGTERPFCNAGLSQ